MARRDAGVYASAFGHFFGARSQRGDQARDLSRDWGRFSRPFHSAILPEPGKIFTPIRLNYPLEVGSSAT